MIQKFNQFINESAGAQNPLSIHEAINEPFTEFIETNDTSYHIENKDKYQCKEGTQY